MLHYQGGFKISVLILNVIYNHLHLCKQRLFVLNQNNLV